MNNIIKMIECAGLLPVIKLTNADDAVPLCHALADGGLNAAEITFRADAAEESIRRARAEMPDMLIAAGTITNVSQAEKAISAGADFIVSPGMSKSIAKYCAENSILYIPGCATPTEIMQALDINLSILKFFPAEQLGGAKMIKALSAPFGNARFMPTGGINAENMGEYAKLPCVLAIGGSWMVPSDAIDTKNWGKITSLTRSALALFACSKN